MEGWGGPPKGPGNHGPGPGRPPGVKNGEGKKARTRALLEEAAPLAAQRLIDIMNAPLDPRNMAAAQSILNKTGFHDKSGVEHSGPDGEPIDMSLTVRFVDPGGD